MTDRTWTVEDIKRNITTDARWTERALLALFEQQTSQEQLAARTVEHNSRGFNAVDAEILTSFALWVIRGRSLTARQLACAQKKLGKYAAQLTTIANNNL